MSINLFFKIENVIDNAIISRSLDCYKVVTNIEGDHHE